jgi:hypothetical protein
MCLVPTIYGHGCKHDTHGIVYVKLYDEPLNTVGVSRVRTDLVLVHATHPSPLTVPSLCFIIS